MALTVEMFKDRFPEFSRAGRTLVQAKLDQASRNMDVVTWGDLFDDGQGQRAAHLLALSPEAVEAGLRMGAGANQITVYQAEFEKLERIVGGSYRTVLD